MPLLCLSFFLIFLGLVNFFANRAAKHDRKQRDDFFEKENAANSTLKQDISALPYISIKDSILNLDSLGNSDIESSLGKIKALSSEQILNLTGLSNTELKTRYGAGNLQTLSDCDNRFTLLITELNILGRLYIEENNPSLAKTVLEYAIGLGSDISETYINLAGLYKEDGQTEKINNLIALAANLTSLSKDSIIQKLDNLVHN